MFGGHCMAVKRSSSGADNGKVAGISDEAVKAATGKSWEQWCRLLDKAGAKSLPHKEIAQLIHRKHGLSGWWSQMVTVGYEQARGLREMNMSCRGDFQGSVSRTINAPVDTLYAAWKDARLRRAWLGSQSFTVRKATENKSLRITWPDETNVEVNFYAKAPDKSQVAVQHGKLAKASDVARVKKLWTAALNKLKSQTEERVAGS